MTTAVLLPTAGDPKLARYWLRNFETWRDQVDSLEVFVNGDTSSVPLYEAAGAKVTAVDIRLIHGVALTELVKATTAETVVLMEDDAFVRRPESIGTYLSAAWLGDQILGCPRGGMSPELHEATREKWGPDPVGPDTSAGYGLWPCFLFARTDALRAVADHRWSSLSWNAGEVIPGLEMALPVETQTDTGTLMAYQLRARYPIVPIAQYKEMWQKDLAEMTSKVGISPPWFHAGGLANEPETIRPDIGMDNNEGRDWAHRFWWWRRIGHDYSAYYQRANLDPDYWTPIIEPWINWDE